MKRLLFFLPLFLITVSCNTQDSTSNLSEYTFFKVGETNPDTGESFIIALTDSIQIEQARNIISDPENTTDKIVLAKIVPQNGSEDFLNIDLNNGNTWSWRIDEFIGFVFTTIEIYDG